MITVFDLLIITKHVPQSQHRHKLENTADTSTHHIHYSKFAGSVSTYSMQSGMNTYTVAGLVVEKHLERKNGAIGGSCQQKLQAVVASYNSEHSYCSYDCSRAGLIATTLDCLGMQQQMTLWSHNVYIVTKARLQDALGHILFHTGTAPHRN